MQTAQQALVAAEAFIAGFEDDSSQEGVSHLLAQIRDAIAQPAQAAEVLAVEIRQCAETARRCDPETKGSISYPAMCGALQATITHFVRRQAGDSAAQAIASAFKDAYREPGDDDAKGGAA